MIKLGSNTITPKGIKKVLLGSDIVYQKTPYTPLTYIESTGTQYIDTGVKPKYDSSNNCTNYEISLSNQDITTSTHLFGSRVGYQNDWLIIAYSTETNVGYRIGFEDQRQDTGIMNSNNHIISLNNGICLIDNVNVRNFSRDVFSNNYNLYLFACNNAGSLMQPAKMRLYYCKIYNGSTLLRDYIPVLDSNNVACLYDKVTDTFFYNQGTGDFNYA